MIARLEVTRGSLTEFPIAEKVRGGWQNGVAFYPDAQVNKITPLHVQTESIPAEIAAILSSRGIKGEDARTAWATYLKNPDANDGIRVRVLLAALASRADAVKLVEEHLLGRMEDGTYVAPHVTFTAWEIREKLWDLYDKEGR